MPPYLGGSLSSLKCEAVLLQSMAILALSFKARVVDLGHMTSADPVAKSKRLVRGLGRTDRIEPHPAAVL
nr:unknown protein [Synechococcus elongatus PCC 7942 = FACHB-805]